MSKHDNTAAVKIENLSFHYGDRYVLDRINFEIPNGAFIGLVGPNGSGKSTLIKCILGLLKPQSGRVSFFGIPLGRFKNWEEVGYVSQKANSFNTAFPATVYEVVSMGLFGKVGLFRFLTKKHKQKIMGAIETVGMTEFTHRNIGELSGGQQQRVFIARALVSDPRLLILDEPTVGVDAASVSNFYQMLKSLNEEKGLTLLLVTHDVGVMSDYVTHVACLNNQLHFHGDTKEFKEISKEGFSQMYGHHVHVLEHLH
ncbi:MULTISPECIES: metal ABC transporter ATP-binding protein [Fictibacillus]|uniref:Zinc ABC transporter ATP-binding protein n=1 Tax=Fictibacillus enclensis TaxID=1017270 RepID=A0A0V8JFC7_9BACL|nr:MULTISPECIES: metal ABC transporter ATP-binding protein [Fictibacillus]KSU85783.1 zinc ABC transporter ATP-binding protein [Fictibacillus enclensis]RXY98504.1 metal ABC transporter ATP-binding protein [Fictibacillus sp. S7]SCC02506.1 zinc transport system ATP-binding protein [Fictibacillus enclensis]